MGDVAKVFWSGRSQAVRLPKAYRFEDGEVRIRREGRSVILEPVGQDIAAAAADEIDRLRQAIREGHDSGDAGVWDLDAVKREVREGFAEDDAN